MSLELGPSCPALRANLFPKVTYPFYRLPLPTFFHRPEVVHVGDLMQLRVRQGTNDTRSFEFSRASGGASETTKVQ
ncbi:hypothetical protein Scep_004492 [Stephania cephalantha]|uniref:Uncharacterized protein n=1 Tax=Stephania cephalantha TaxID=152367 RepID=A0AAP0KSK2_9MAGN